MEKANHKTVKALQNTVRRTRKVLKVVRRDLAELKRRVKVLVKVVLR